MSSILPSTMPRNTVECLRIEAGQTLHLQADARTTLRLLHGAAVLHEAPLWLGERMVSASQRLVRGQPYKPTQAGWLRIDALVDGVEVACCREPVWPRRAWPSVATRLVDWFCSLRGAHSPVRSL